MVPVYIAGIATTVFGRHLDRPVHDLARDALEAATRDAGCSSADIGVAFYSGITQGHLQGQVAIPGHVVLGRIGIDSIPIFNVESACASGSAAFHLAVQSLRAGSADVALVLGSEKMNILDKSRVFELFDGGWDVARSEESQRILEQMSEGLEIPMQAPACPAASVFMAIAAGLSRAHMKTHGTTQRQIAAVAAKNHQHSVLNPNSQAQRTYSIDEILTAPAVLYPLTVPMCAPLADGAAAAILCTDEGLRRIGADRKRCVRVSASVLRSFGRRRLDQPELHLARLAAQQAYEQAGLGPEDMDVAEVHDVTAMGEIIQVENLGFVSPGEGGPASERGEFALGGRLPVNPSGGLESRGHPLGATGLTQLHELTTQLRDEAGARQVRGARHAIQQNDGGFHGIEEASVAVHVLSR
jgi:acetyl-CoA acetyltransferase